MEGEYNIGKKWETTKAKYTELLKDGKVKLIIATDKRSNTQHLLAPKELKNE